MIKRGQTIFLPAADALKQCLCNVYSQYGEDGLIAGIFAWIGERNRFFVDVGAADGVMFSNTRVLAENGWRGIAIDCDPQCVKRLREVSPATVTVLERKVLVSGDDRIDAILEQHGAPQDLDFMSIDVDGQDWLLWNSLVRYRPRVICVEHDPERHGLNCIPVRDGQGQAGLDALQWLAASKGYTIVAVTYTNVIAISGDHANEQGNGKPAE